MRAGAGIDGLAATESFVDAGKPVNGSNFSFHFYDICQLADTTQYLAQMRSVFDLNFHA